MGDETPVNPPESAPAPPEPAVPAGEPAATPLDQTPLGDFVKRRVKGESDSAAPPEKSEDEPGSEPDEKIPGKSDLKAVPKTRFDQIYRQRSDALRDLQAERTRSTQLEQELQQLRQKPAEPAASSDAPKAPTLDEYLAAGKTYEDWMDARIEWRAQGIADARIQADRARSQQETQQTERQREIGGLAERTEAAKAKYPDYEQIVMTNDRVHLSPVMTEIVARSPHGPDIMYWLGTHEAEANQLGVESRQYGPAAYPLMEAHLLLLSGQSKPMSTGAKKAVPVSQAPAPISPVGGGSSTTSASLDQMPLGDYVKRRNAIDQKKRTG